MTDAERNLLMTIASFLYATLGVLNLAPPEKLEQLERQYKAVKAEQDANGKDS